MERQSFNPEVILDRGDQAALAATVASPGYRIMHRIFRAEVDKFVLSLINTDAADREDVYARHILAKSAAQFYQGVTGRINEEVLQYTGTDNNPTPFDQTEGILDLGEKASVLDDIDNEILGEGIFHE